LGLKGSKYQIGAGMQQLDATSPAAIDLPTQPHGERDSSTQRQVDVHAFLCTIYPDARMLPGAGAAVILA
jgi:hypothetical protein